MGYPKVALEEAYRLQNTQGLAKSSELRRQREHEIIEEPNDESVAK